MRIKTIFAMLIAATTMLLTMQSVWAINFITVQDAYNNVSAGTGIIIDVRTVEEHNSCNAAWAGGTSCPNSEARNWGAPQWTDTASGVTMLGPNIPYWWKSNTGTVPENPAEFASFFEELRLAGVINYDTPLYLICRSGYRSYWGGVYIESLNLGYTNIYTVDVDTNPDNGSNNGGGMLAWSDAGLPKHTDSDNNPGNRGWVPPQIYSDSPADGYVETSTNTVNFTAKVIAPPWGRGFDDLFPVIKVSLYIDGAFVEDATIAGTGYEAKQFYTFSPQTLTAGSHTWNVRAENEVTFNNTSPGEVSWNLNAHDHLPNTADGLSGPGERTLTIDVPDISVSPASVPFGGIRVGTPSSIQTVTITNDGTADLAITAIDYSSLNPAQFTVANGCGSSLVPTASCDVTVQFTPDATGPFSGSIDISSDDPDEGTVQVNVSGTGIVPDIAASPSLLDYGTVTVSSTPKQAVTIQNNGTDVLNVTSIGTPSLAQFSIVTGGTCSATPFALAISANCTLMVQFAPDAANTFNSSFDITSDDPDTPTTQINVTGTGTNTAVPNINITPASLPFGGIRVGVPSSIQTVTISNEGSADLNVTSIVISSVPTQFAVSNNCGNSITLTPSASCDITVQFTPDATGLFNGNIVVSSNDQNSPVQVDLSGTGIAPDIAISPPSLDFGAVTTGNTSQQTVTIQNNGTDVLSVTGISAPTSSQFSTVSGGTCSTVPFTLAASQDCTLMIQFAPDAETTFSDSFDITSDDPDTPTIQANISGTGTGLVVPDIKVTSLLDFGGVIKNGGWSEQTVTVTNEGTSDLIIGDIAIAANQLAEPFSMDSGTDTCSNQTLAATNSCTLTVQFAPITEGNNTDSFDIPSNDPDESLSTVHVTGIGLAQMNNPPYPVNLISPTDGETGLGTTLEFIWEKAADPDGDPVSYNLYWCENSDFSGCSSEAVASSLQTIKTIYYAGIKSGGVPLLAGIIFTGGFMRRRRKIQLVTLVAVALMLSACDKGNDSDNPGVVSNNVSYTVSGLKSNTIYYYKVIAKDDKGGATESETRSFTTQ